LKQVGSGWWNINQHKKYIIPLSIQPCWFQDEWNKQLVCLNDWAHDLFQWLAQPLSNNIFNQWTGKITWTYVAKLYSFFYLKFLVHWQHEQASSCHLHRQYNINEGPIVPYPKSVTIVDQQEKIMLAWEFWNQPGFHLHQLLSYAHPREQNHAVLQRQSAGTCNNNIESLSSQKEFCTKLLNIFLFGRHTFSNPRPCVNGALPVAINAASTCRIEETTDYKYSFYWNRV